MWKEVPVRFEGRSFVEVLEMCGALRSAIAKMGTPTDLSDEHFLMLRAAGYDGRDGAQRFKEETVLDIMSGDYGRIWDIAKRVNQRSGQLAKANKEANDAFSTA